MKNFTIIALILITIISCKENPETQFDAKNQGINTDLKEKLKHILLMDQGIRKLYLGDLSEREKNDLLIRMDLTEEYGQEALIPLMKKIDSINLVKVENIIDKFGYPGKSLVGEPANKTVFYVIQHSDKIEQYLPLIRKAAQNDDISMKKLAKMEDRYLMEKGEEQIYGTQIRGQKLENGEWVHFVWPIKNPDSVNIIREKIGLESIEEYAKGFGIDYEALTLDDVKNL
ncbi:MAG TPA: DUF6624 domain-containing protein [Salinimicrobium sp.]|nr:DUF6624 domain-containing protein [Salinimicrobium sp.]